MPTKSKKKEVIKSATQKSKINSISSKNKKTDSKTRKASITSTKKTTLEKIASSTKNKLNSKKDVSSFKKKVQPTKNSVEYFDLPNNYNKTMVKVLFQTPNKLFVYWEISENDRKDLLNYNGDNFFEHSIPFLIVRNNTKNYYFEIQINDYANSWYFDVPDSNCEYTVDLVRKFNNVPIQISSSNELEVPNNHILFEQNRKEIFFKNVKTNHVISKNVANLHLINYIGISKPVTLNAFYNKFYDEKDFYAISNPTSHL